MASKIKESPATEDEDRALNMTGPGSGLVCMFCKSVRVATIGYRGGRDKSMGP